MLTPLKESVSNINPEERILQYLQEKQALTASNIKRIASVDVKVPNFL